MIQISRFTLSFIIVITGADAVLSPVAFSWIPMKNFVEHSRKETGVGPGEARKVKLSNFQSWTNGFYWGDSDDLQVGCGNDPYTKYLEGNSIRYPLKSNRRLGALTGVREQFTSRAKCEGGTCYQINADSKLMSSDTDIASSYLKNPIE